ncbi:morphogenic membrane protein MmpB [Kitasatospora sp. NPDC050543]
MLWSDPRDEPSPETRRVQQRLHRAGPVLAVLTVLMAVLMML